MHVEGLTWTISTRNRQLYRYPESIETNNVGSAIAELAVGFWQPTKHGYRVLHHMQHQPEPEVTAERRELAVDRNRKLRRKGRTRR